VIDAIVITKIVVVYFGCWASGFGMGKAVAWTRALRTVA
jgi:hypothetical protein